MSDELVDHVANSFLEKARKMVAVAMIVKIGLVLLGALLAGISAVFSTGSLWPLTPLQWVGIAGVFIAFVGGVMVVYMEDDSEQLLETARRALDQASRHELHKREIYSNLLEYELATKRLKALYTVMSLARGVLEQSVSRTQTDEERLLRTCLETTGRDLEVALGFDVGDIWTIGIYRALSSAEEGARELHLKAHRRSVNCDIAKARVWKEGVGVGGIALAKNDEVVIPDLDDAAMGTVFRLDKKMRKEEDKTSYKSLFAVPVAVGSDTIPWGVVLATSNNPYHFGRDDNTGVDPEEAVRALAGVVAMVVAVCRSNDTSSDQTGSGEEKDGFFDGD